MKTSGASRRSAWWQALGPLAAAAALAALCAMTGPLMRSGPARDLLVAERVADCVAHGEGAAAEFSTGKLDSARMRLARNLEVLLGSLALAILAVGVARVRGRASSPLAIPLVAAVCVAAFQTWHQVGLTRRAWHLGVFTESDAEREVRFFDRASRAAAHVRRAVPEGARFLVTDFADAQDVKKVGYLVFPRRMFMLPNSSIRSTKAELLQLLQDYPESFDWARRFEYTHAVDLKTLVLDDDPTAIVSLTEGR